MGLIRCAAYYALTGFVFFLFGRFVPKKHFNPNSFPYKAFEFENDGEIYEKLGIKSWQSKLPDMSKIFTHFMPPKSMASHPDSTTISIMLKETCVAELIHAILMLFGLGSFRFFKAKTALVVYFIFFFINLPFILVQRYNRPRLKRLLEACKKREPDELNPITA